METILEKLVGNPIHVYCLIDRLSNQIADVQDEIRGIDKLTDVAKHVDEILKLLNLWLLLPTSLDMEGVTQNIARIQFAYGYDPVDLAGGVIGGVATSARLSTDDCMEIAIRRASGEHPINRHTSKEFALAIEWAEAAYHLAGFRQKGETFISKMFTAAFEWSEAAAHWLLGYQNDRNMASISGIRHFLDETKLEHDKHWISPKQRKGHFPSEDFFISKFNNEDVSGRQLRFHELLLVNLRNDTNWDFYTLCRDQNITLTDHQCFLTVKDNLYFLLAPLKLEIISSDPPMYIFHEILTEGEIKYIKKESASKLISAPIQDERSGSSEKRISNERTQASGWLWDQEHPLLYKLSQKTSGFTSLDCARPQEMMSPRHPLHFVEAEAWQIGIYSPGGQYLPHFDSFHILGPESRGISNIWVGNRVATAMFYLSDLVGGRTAFPNLGLVVEPKKGSAVFWFNLKHDGSIDERSLHGACPSVLGIKWVSNKWIREGAQIWKDQCKKMDGHF